ncbi:MAG: hypothetical protein NTV22_11290 [bacterium]|nr:hypothetical protein [bacterium]
MAIRNFMPASYKRVAVGAESTYGTDPGLTSAACIPVSEPVFKQNGSALAYNMMRDSRYLGPQAVNRIFNSLDFKVPFFVPTTGVGATCAGTPASPVAFTVGHWSLEIAALATQLKVMLGAAGCIAYEWVDTSEKCIVFHLDEAWTSYTSATLYFQEVAQTMKLLGAFCNVKLNFSVSNPLYWEFSFSGMESDKNPYYTDGYTTLNNGVKTLDGTHKVAVLDPPADNLCGILPRFERCIPKVWKLGDPEPLDAADYSALAGYTFDFGNTVETRDDGGSPYGVAGLYVANDLSGQKVTLNIEMPRTHSDLPYVTHFKQYDILRYKFTLPGSFTTGIRISGLLQITEPPALSKDGNIMRVGLTGLCVLPLQSTGDIGTNRIHPWLLTIYQKTA